MAEKIGQLTGPAGNVLCKMWMVNIAPKSRPFLPHRHREFEIALVLNGCGEYRTQNKVYLIKKGAVFLFCSNEIHCITKISGAANLQILTLQFAPDLIEPYVTDYNGVSCRDLIYTHAPEFENCISEHTEIQELLYSLQAEFKKQSAYHTMLIPLRICEILFITARRFSYRAPSAAFSGAGGYTTQTMDYINRHFKENIRMADLAAVTGVTPNYLSKVFKNASGISVWDYLAVTRINHAKKQLAGQTQTNIIDIALECGYNNTANFNKAFKKYTEMTPRQYRLRAKGKINIDI